LGQHPFQDPGSPFVGAVTMGLSKFVGREIELEGCASQFKSILTTGRGLITYLLQNDGKVPDGDTIGVTENERISLRFEISCRFTGLTVIAVTLAPA
jgi:Domain of unknown function (DUF4261)